MATATTNEDHRVASEPPAAITDRYYPGVAADIVADSSIRGGLERLSQELLTAKHNRPAVIAVNPGWRERMNQEVGREAMREVESTVDAAFLSEVDRILAAEGNGSAITAPDNVPVVIRPPAASGSLVIDAAARQLMVADGLGGFFRPLGDTAAGHQSITTTGTDPGDLADWNRADDRTTVVPQPLFPTAPWDPWQMPLSPNRPWIETPQPGHWDDSHQHRRDFERIMEERLRQQQEERQAIIEAENVRRILEVMTENKARDTAGQRKKEVKELDKHKPVNRRSRNRLIGPLPQEGGLDDDVSYF